ncbi:hypothetical protein [Vibrio marisflavi]|uniref:Uncharacterized protein n=1 Tax=Vibrio marisflavi CECT 7928 TaxID=634439 RepID=A0ABM9A590_9VIBR|nr:hypothetical protein [Vibrio marisflavi]CAH0539760.1 hypothetical protein VMF7928_02423 [Vibrio marisflavi CECT 7928]
MVTVDKHDGITLKISHAIGTSKRSNLDIYLFVPGELGLSQEIISESDFYYSSINQKRTYYSDKTLLPLVHSRLAKRKRLSSRQYRVSLSLFAYQYVIALDKAVNNINSLDKESITEQEIDEVIELALDILKRLRRSIPYEENLKRYYANIDNYLSWYTEQNFLSLVAHLPRNDDYATLKSRLINIVERETAHRRLNNYNSEKVRSDLTRMSNKMRLLRRLIEHPIVLKEKTTSLGKNLRRASKGIATGFVMVFVTILAITAREYWGEITVSFIVLMSILYALREIFKDDLRDVLLRWVRKDKPKWRKRYFDPTTNKIVGQKLEWLDYKVRAILPDRIKTIRKKRVVQREEKILHYHSETEMSTSRFMSGYEETKDALLISMRALTRLMDKGSNKVYSLNKGQVVRESVDKRHLFNLIIQENGEDGGTKFYRWKIILNRTKIVAIEQIDIDD